VRVLFCCHPGLSHFLPLAPLAWAFRAEGHDVLVSIADCAPQAAGSGLEIVDVAPDFDMNDVNERVAAEHPELMEAMATTPMTDAESWAAGIAAVNRPLVPGNIALADDWQPDLVVYDQANTVGLLVADRRGIPAIQQTIGGFSTGRMHKAIAEHLGDLCTRYGVSVSEPAVKLEFYPPSLLTREPEGQFVRWVPYNGGMVISGRLPAPPNGRHRVAVSMGTSDLQAFGPGALVSIVEAAARVDADFVLATGDVDITSLGELPPNIQHVGWTPLSALLRTCTALIHQGGAGNALNAVAANIPQLIVHDPANLMYHITCNAVRERNIGLALSSDQLDSATIETLISDGGLRRATEEVHIENKTLPSPAATARAILDGLS
jgi:calicheamicinone 4-hydroxyamino-4,6-dideoxy-alpha-D-glucosyltransferase